MNKYKKMTREELKEIVRSYTDFSKYTREEMLDKIEEINSKLPFPEMKVLLKDIQTFSDEELKEYFKSLYCSDWTRDDLLWDIERHEEFEELSREELEEKYLNLEEKKYNKETIIMGIILFAYMIISSMVFSRIENGDEITKKEREALEQKIEQQEEKIESMEDVINAIIYVYILQEDENTPII